MRTPIFLAPDRHGLLNNGELSWWCTLKGEHDVGINVRDHLIYATVVYLIQAINKMHKGLTSHAIHNM